MQELANIKLKTNSFGSTVTREYVTPIEALFLAAAHSERAGSDPLLEIKMIPSTEEQDLVALNEELARVQSKATLNASDESILTELRAQRAQSYAHDVKTLMDKIQMKEALLQIRAFEPAEEQQRLSGRYGSGRVTKLFSTNIPQTLSTFDRLGKVKNKSIPLSQSGFLGENTMGVFGDVSALTA